MPRRNSFFPFRRGDQILWVRNWRSKIGGYQTAGGYTAADINATLADADSVLQLLATWHPGTQSFAQAATAYLKLALYGPIATSIAAVPVYTGNNPGTVPPAPGAWPAAVPPGALLRIFAFIKNMKTRAFCTAAVQQDLGVVGAEANVLTDPAPPASAEARSGEVAVHFTKKMPTERKSHKGVWIESQVADETEWTFLAIQTAEPYRDIRPLKVPNQPEKRRYRLCFWDGEPSRVWTDVIEVVYGG